MTKVFRPSLDLPSHKRQGGDGGSRTVHNERRAGLHEIALHISERDRATLRGRYRRTRDVADFPIGIMLEVPAAAMCIGSLLREVDYVSIGSNDLIQYVMAADRDNPKVAHLCDPFSPPIFRLLRHILRACEKHQKPATLCGEMAGRPRCFLPLLGMGLRQFSVTPHNIPEIKKIIRSITIDEAKVVAREVRRLETARDVNNYLREQTRRILPEVMVN